MNDTGRHKFKSCHNFLVLRPLLISLDELNSIRQHSEFLLGSLHYAAIPMKMGRLGIWVWIISMCPFFAIHLFQRKYLGCNLAAVSLSLLMRKRLSGGQKWFLKPYFPLIRGMFVFRSGLRFSFRALEVPEPRVRKRPYEKVKVAFSSLSVRALPVLETKI